MFLKHIKIKTLIQCQLKRCWLRILQTLTTSRVVKRRFSSNCILQLSPHIRQFKLFCVFYLCRIILWNPRRCKCYYHQYDLERCAFYKFIKFYELLRQDELLILIKYLWTSETNRQCIQNLNFRDSLLALCGFLSGVSNFVRCRIVQNA